MLGKCIAGPVSSQILVGHTLKSALRQALGLPEDRFQHVSDRNLAGNRPGRARTEPKPLKQKLFDLDHELPAAMLAHIKPACNKKCCTVRSGIDFLSTAFDIRFMSLTKFSFL